MCQNFELSLKKKYFAHFHTNYTDGAASVHEYCEWASENGFGTIIFSEHVRKELSFDFKRYMSDIAGERQKFPGIEIYSGVETKIMPDGKPDVSKDVASTVQIIYFACHAFPNDPVNFEKTFGKVFSEGIFGDKIRIWAHPERFFIKNGFGPESVGIMERLIATALNNGVFIEKNLKSFEPISYILNRVNREKVIIGFDAHSIEEADRLSYSFNSIFN